MHGSVNNERGANTRIAAIDARPNALPMIGGNRTIAVTAIVSKATKSMKRSTPTDQCSPNASSDCLQNNFSIDAEAALRIENSGNEQREDFTVSEKLDYGLAEEIEKADKRMLSGKKIAGDELVNRGSQGQAGRTRDIVAEKLGMSGRQYDRAKYVAKNASPEVIERIDNGGLSISGVYNELRNAKKVIKPSTSDVPDESAATRHMSYAQAVKTDPFFKKLKAEEDETARKRREFDALPPDGKIAELRRQIKELLVRAVTAESELAMLKENHGISVDHKDSIIESLKQRNAEIIGELTAANMRIAELETKIQ